MYKTKVLLNSLDKVRRFINIVSHFDDVDMDICCGRYIVDAKSIMGILSMSLTTPLELRINAQDKHLKEILDAFLAIQISFCQSPVVLSENAYPMLL